MKCPRCGENTQDDWKPLQTTLMRQDREPVGETGLANMFERSLPLGKERESGRPDREFLTLDWMRCEAKDCFQLVIRCHETRITWAGHVPIQRTTTRNLYPAASPRDAAPVAVPESMRRDYDEAGTILDPSPRMAAVLARKLVGDLLTKYAKRNENRFTSQIDNFLAQPGIPAWISSGLHHVREAADMSAHTQEEQGEAGEATVIEIDRDEAEWTLDFVLRLFDHFILGPAKDAEIQARIEDKSRRAGRRPFGRDKRGE